MRSSILLSAALALGAVAVPHKRDGGVYTEVDVVVVTKTVYVTATGLPPVSEAAVSVSEAVKHYSHYHHKKPSSSPAPVESAPAYTPPVASAPAYTPPASSAPAYTPPASAPAYTPAPSPSPVKSSAAPVSSAASGIGPAHVVGDKEADLTSGEDYENMILFHHNIHRANHSAGALTWDNDLATKALSCAQCSNWPFHHCNAMQNMAASGPIANVSAGITEGWYNGEMPNYANNYGLKNPTGDFESFGHFSQLVWAGATKVGCGTVNCVADSNIGMFITVCNYDDGNVGDAYGDNVHKPNGAPECHWDD